MNYKVPPFLYHGTTLRRYNKIKLKGLKGDMPRSLKFDKGHVGYCFFTTSKAEAAMYALITYYLDCVYNVRLDRSTDEVVILKIRTSPYVRKLEVDPEWENQNVPKKIKDFIGDSVWWRVFGDVKLKDIVEKDMLTLGAQNLDILKVFKEHAVMKALEDWDYEAVTKLTDDLKNKKIKNKEYVNRLFDLMHGMQSQIRREKENG